MNFLFDIVFPQFVLVYKFVQYYILEIGAGVRKKFLNTAYKNSFHRSTWCQTLNYCYLSAHYLFIYMYN